MKKTVLRTSLSFLAICALSNAALLIDDFTTPQTRVDISSGSTNTGLLAPTALGGARNISLAITTENTPNEASYVVANGTLDFSNGIGVASTLTVIWDGGTDSTLTPNGFTPVDLTQAGTNNRISLSTLGDFALNSTLTLWSGAGNTATYNFVLPSSPTLTQVDLLFGAQNSATGTFNFNSVTAARLVINGITNSDRSIDFVSATGTEVPEPATYGMIGIGAIAWAVVSRKRK